MGHPIHQKATATLRFWVTTGKNEGCGFPWQWVHNFRSKFSVRTGGFRRGKSHFIGEILQHGWMRGLEVVVGRRGADLFELHLDDGKFALKKQSTVNSKGCLRI